MTGCVVWKMASAMRSCASNSCKRASTAASLLLLKMSSIMRSTCSGCLRMVGRARSRAHQPLADVFDRIDPLKIENLIRLLSRRQTASHRICDAIGPKHGKNRTPPGPMPVATASNRKRGWPRQRNYPEWRPHGVRYRRDCGASGLPCAGSTLFASSRAALNMRSRTPGQTPAPSGCRLTPHRSMCRRPCRVQHLYKEYLP